MCCGILHFCRDILIVPTKISLEALDALKIVTPAVEKLKHSTTLNK